MSTGGGGLGHR